MTTYHYPCDFRDGKYWHTYQSMESRLNRISRYILIDPDNKKTYSEELAEFLISLGSAVDSFFRNMSECPDINAHRHNIGITQNMENLGITEYRTFSESFFELSSSTITLPFGLGKRQDIHPFHEFRNDKSPEWWKDYNSVKHDYHKNLKKATLLNVINALGALFLLNIFHKCSRLLLFPLGIFQDMNHTLSRKEAELAFIYTPKGTTGYAEPGDFVFVRGPHFFFRFTNYEP